MKTVAAQYIDREIFHVVVDNLGTHFTPKMTLVYGNTVKMAYLNAIRRAL